MTYLVTGARGQVGRAVIDALLAAGKPVRAASSRPEDTTVPAAVPVVGLDPADPASAAAAVDGVERAFLYAAGSGIDTLVAAAKAAGVQHITLLSSSAAATPGNPIGDRHLVVERPLQESGLPLTILRPGAFAGNARWWLSGVRSDGVVGLPFPEVQQNPIHEADIADAAVISLTEPGHAGKIYPLTGPESLSLRRMVELLAEAVDRPLRVERISYDQAKAFLYEPVLAMWAAAGDAPAPVGPTAESVTGKPARTFAQWAADHATELRSATA
ncbi:SDR family oxidoreductase [Nocardia sp. alder85J]|uniref:SDR family oxidoreductase n=1 Tax=Nocardia sp. alder85J TaxID=2862949 RepID=UPI001CD39114|nr:NAD(P)H-binding protein [Nocardia sp. alder85J]MCX4093932.1 NAD(P)H-binding protein [Nocardia sp. alder85J]